MTVYKDVNQINRIIDIAPDNFDFYVHIDKKSDITSSKISKRANVYKEYSIYWGAVEHLKAFLLLMKKAFASNIPYDFYHLITGQDFYAIPFSQFDSLLQNGYIYMDIFSLPRKNWWNGGFDIVKYKTLASKIDLRKRKNKILNKLYYIWQKVTGVGNPLPSYSMAGGSVYCSICGGGR